MNHERIKQLLRELEAEFAEPPKRRPAAPPREGARLTFAEIAALIFITAASGIVLLDFIR